MAKSWTAAEAIVVIREGKDMEAIYDISKRFPMFAMACVNVKTLELISR